MTKKDFEVIAETIASARRTVVAQSNASELRKSEGERAIDSVIGAFADRFAQMNPRFNRATFLRACGFDGVSS